MSSLPAWPRSYFVQDSMGGCLTTGVGNNSPCNICDTYDDSLIHIINCNATRRFFANMFRGPSMNSGGGGVSGLDINVNKSVVAPMGSGLPVNEATCSRLFRHYERVPMGTGEGGQSKQTPRIPLGHEC